MFVVFGWVRNLGLILLLFAAWQVWGTSIEQAHSQQTLRQEFQKKVQHVTSIPAATSLLPASSPPPTPHPGSVVAHIQIPAIGVNQYVVEGTAEADLAEGPGHYIGTSFPGQEGNVGIAGHRTTYGAPFNQLDKMKIGDSIELTTDSGETLTYSVSQPPTVVAPTDVAVLNTFDDNRLTLTTCNPKYSSSQRLVVVALLSEPSPTTSTSVSITPRTVHVASDPVGWNMTFLPEVLGLLVIVVLLGLLRPWARRHFGRVGQF